MPSFSLNRIALLLLWSVSFFQQKWDYIIIANFDIKLETWWFVLKSGNKVLLKSAGSSFFCLDSANKTQYIKGDFLAIFSTFLKFCKEEPKQFKRFFLTFLAYFSMSKKTQDVFGCFLLIFSRFFNSIKKNQDI